MDGDWSQRQVDRADEHEAQAWAARMTAWEKLLLSDERARERRIMDGEDRRMMSWFDTDPIEMGDDLFGVSWEP